MDKGKLKRVLALVSVTGLIAGGALSMTGCKSTGSCGSSCSGTTKTDTAQSSCSAGSCTAGSCAGAPKQTPEK